ncbi:MAG: hypothetical protein QM722_22675 [Piscinibacter sp.]
MNLLLATRTQPIGRWHLLSWSRRLACQFMLGWLAHGAYLAFKLVATAHRCATMAGPFLPCGPGPDAWQHPLLVGLLPAALLGIMVCIRQVIRQREH